MRVVSLALAVALDSARLHIFVVLGLLPRSLFVILSELATALFVSDIYPVFYLLAYLQLCIS